MRLFRFIFAIYFLSLSLTPCSDEILIDNCAIELTCSHFENTHSDHEDADACNPLCMCNCCGGITLVSQSNNNLVEIPFISFHNIYLEKNLTPLSYSIWQPPKVG